MEKQIFQQRFLSNLNPQQLEAATTVNGPILLLAVPGSGKTTVLVTRLGYMVHCCGVAPESILTLTYTVAATKEMKQRFAGKFGGEYAGKMAFWTINGLSARIILYYSKNHGKSSAFQLLESDADINRILMKLRELPTMTAEKAVACIWNYSGYKEYVKKNNLDAGKFEILRILAKNESTAQGLLRRLNELSEIVKTHENTPSIPFLLSTIHSSKGLEYEKVYLMDAIDEIFPSTPASRIEDESDMETIRLYEEERRLFYVGMTRAKRELNIFDVALREQSFVRECCIALGLEKPDPAPSGPLQINNSDPFPFDPKPFPGMTPVARNKVADISAYTVGCVLIHKAFGPGHIESITGKFASVDFGGETGLKKIDLNACELRGTITKG